MNKLIRIIAPAAVAVAAFGVNAQTIETDYPVVSNAGQVVAASKSVSAVASPKDVYLIQSNSEGAKVAPAYVESSALTRDDVRSGATVRILQAPDSNV